MPHPRRAGFCWPACLSATLIAAAAVAAARGGPLDKYTGYTRIGHPPTRGDGEKAKPAEADDQKAIGVTIYYMVLDRKSGSKGGYGDTWGVGIKNFDATYVAGLNNDRDALDVEARYLYLYQVVNDREGTKAAVKDVSVRLIVDPRLITSWGHFRLRDGGEAKAVRGVGFAMDFLNPKEKEAKYLTQAVSTIFQGVSDKRYQNPAPAIRAPRPYGLKSINVGKVRDVVDEADVGKAPETVLLVPNADFGPAGARTYLKPAMASDARKLPELDDLEARRRMREQYRNRWPAIRAYWRDPDNQIKPRQRSTIFGFTCDLPPTLELVSVGGRGMGIGLGKLEQPDPPQVGLVNFDHNRANDAAPEEQVMAGPDALRRILKQRGEGADLALPPISGTLPTPTLPTAQSDSAVARDRAPARPSEARTTERARGGLSGVTPAQETSAPTGGAPFLASAANANAGGGLLAGSGGGGGGGSGGGSSGGGGSSAQINPAVPVAPGAGTTVRLNNSNLNVATQSQAQAQAQGQAQEQSQGQAVGSIVPAPPAWLLGLVGLPVLAFFARRRGRPGAS